jgi:hypothetical protein
MQRSASPQPGDLRWGNGQGAPPARAPLLIAIETGLVAYAILASVRASAIRAAYLAFTYALLWYVLPQIKRRRT